MPISIPNVNTQIEQPNVRNAKEEELHNFISQAMLKGKEGGIEALLQAQKGNQSLEQLLKGKAADQANEQTNAARVKQEAEDFQKANPTAQFSIGPDGKREVHPVDPLEKWLKIKTLQDHEKDSLDRKTHQLGDSIEKSKIPEALSQADALNSATAGDKTPGVLQGGHLKSLGGWKNMVPDWAAGAAEHIPFVNQAFPQGSGQERQAYRGLQNAAMHAQFGARQTDAERHMLAQQMGDYSGNSRDNMEAAIRGLHNQMSQQGQNIMRSGAPDAVAEYGKRGGMTNFQLQPYSTQQFNKQPQGASPGTPPAAAPKLGPGAKVLYQGKPHTVAPDGDTLIPDEQ